MSGTFRVLRIHTYVITYVQTHVCIYDPGSAVPPPLPPPPMVPPHPPPPLWCGVVVDCFPPPAVVWCGVVVGRFPPPCGVVWFGCGLWWFPPFPPCGVVWVGWFPPACLDLLGVLGKPMLMMILMMMMMTMTIIMITIILVFLWSSGIFCPRAC